MFAISTALQFADGPHRSTIQTIVSTSPPDQTLFKEAISVALIGGDVAKVLRLASKNDIWLSAHLCDLFAKLGLLEDPIGENEIQEIGFRDHFLLQYTDMLLSDPTMWRIVVDYLASMDNADIGRGRMRQVLLSIGSTAEVETNVGAMQEAGGSADKTAAVPSNRETSAAAIKRVRADDVLDACAQYDLEDVMGSLCLVSNLTKQPWTSRLTQRVPNRPPQETSSPSRSTGRR